MTHELKKIIQNYIAAKAKGLKSVMATVVALEGSSYRRPGVRMLISEDGRMTGAVSGGCVEKEVLRQSQKVFETGSPVLMTYDGRYRLGCEGILYILIEAFAPSETFIRSFEKTVANRHNFSVRSFFPVTDTQYQGFGSVFRFDHGDTTVTEGTDLSGAETHPELTFFQDELKPCFKLMIIGAEHDAVQLCSMASMLGWEVTVVAPASDPRSVMNFPGAEEVYNISPEMFDIASIDVHTAVILMTHSYVTDLKYLIRIKDIQLAYLGLLGPSKRRERLLNDLLEQYPDTNDRVFENIHGPAGLSIGAETPQEIAVSILSEILSVIRKQYPGYLRDKYDGIHDS